MTRRPLRPIVIALLALVALLGVPHAGNAAVTRTLVPIGSGYEPDTLQRFARAAVERDTSHVVDLLVLPITFSLDAYTTSARERRQNLDLAETRRSQVEAACNVVRRADQTCRAVLAPILIRSDAFLQSNLDLFVADLDGMYILGGDQTVAMRVVADTTTEQRMAAAYNAGAVVGGNSAGAAVESANMIAGYVGDNGPETGLRQGSVDLWLFGGQSDIERGLIFGTQAALLDQHVLQRGRIARLINAAWQTNLLGIGADAETAATIRNETLLTDVAGRSAVFVVDQFTYGATAHYGGPNSSLSIHDAVTHVLPGGQYGYNMLTRQPLVNGQPQVAPDVAGRSFDQLRSAAGSGALLLGGDVRGDVSGLVADRFVSRSGGRSGARLVVLTTGYAKAADARADARSYAATLQPRVDAPVQWFVLDSRTDQASVLAALNNATGVLLSAPDQSRVLGALATVEPIVQQIRTRWQSGLTLFADNAAAAALGQFMSVDAPPTADGLEEDSIVDFRPDGVTLQPGQGFVSGIAVEPRMLPDRHWGRLYNLIARYQQHDLLGLGVDVGTAIEITPQSATAIGSSAVVTLDGSFASFVTGTNGALGARYVLLDTFINGESVAP